MHFFTSTCFVFFRSLRWCTLFCIMVLFTTLVEFSSHARHALLLCTCNVPQYMHSRWSCFCWKCLFFTACTSAFSSFLISCVLCVLSFALHIYTHFSRVRLVSPCGTMRSYLGRATFTTFTIVQFVCLCLITRISVPFLTPCNVLLNVILLIIDWVHFRIWSIEQHVWIDLRLF